MAVKLGPLAIAEIPAVVGTVSTGPALASIGSVHGLACDVIEIRYDLFGGDTETFVLQQARRLESQGIPVLFTCRLANEGGKWENDGAERLRLYEAALEVVSAVDVEYLSPQRERIAAAALARGKTPVVSFHDFARTPDRDALAAIVAATAADPRRIAKISTAVQTQDDIDTLQALLRQPWPMPLCVIGMGGLGAATRLHFPTIGSCLTYGYLDHSAAPGQLPCAELTAQLCHLLPAYKSLLQQRKQLGAN